MERSNWEDIRTIHKPGEQICANSELSRSLAGWSLCQRASRALTQMGRVNTPFLARLYTLNQSISSFTSKWKGKNCLLPWSSQAQRSPLDPCAPSSPKHSSRRRISTNYFYSVPHHIHQSRLTLPVNASPSCAPQSPSARSKPQANPTPMPTCQLRGQGPSLALGG